MVEQILPPPPPPSSPPLTPQQISDLQALVDLQFKTTTAQELHNYLNSENKEELVQEEVKESVNDDSLLSSVHYASDDDDTVELVGDEEKEFSDNEDAPFLYHTVHINGRGNVAIFRSKRAPQHLLYYFTRTGKKAYVKPKHLLSLKVHEFYQVETHGVEPSLLNSPAAGYLHNTIGNCWCSNLPFYL